MNIVEQYRQYNPGDTRSNFEIAQELKQTRPDLASDPSIKQIDQDHARINRGGLGQSFKEGLGRGISGIEQGAKGFMSLFNEVTGDEASANYWARRAQRAQEEAQQKYGSGVAFTDVSSAGDFFHWAAGGLGEVAPSIAQTAASVAATAATGGLAAPTLLASAGGNAIRSAAQKQLIKRIGEKAFKELGQDAVESLVKRESLKLIASTAGKVGAFGSSFAQESGGIYADLALNETIDKDRAVGSALVGGTVNALLDNVLENKLIDRIFKGTKADVIKDEFWKRLVTAKVGKDILGSMSKEALTEGTQEVISMLAKEYADPELNYTPEDFRKTFFDAAALGAIGGALMSGGLNVAQATKGPADTDTDIDTDITLTPEDYAMGDLERELSSAETFPPTVEDTQNMLNSVRSSIAKRNAPPTVEDTQNMLNEIRKELIDNAPAKAPIVEESTPDLTPRTQLSKFLADRKDASEPTKLYTIDGSKFFLTDVPGAKPVTFKSKLDADLVALSEGLYNEDESLTKLEELSKITNLETDDVIALADVVAKNSKNKDLVEQFDIFQLQQADFSQLGLDPTLAPIIEKVAPPTIVESNALSADVISNLSDSETIGQVFTNPIDPTLQESVSLQKLGRSTYQVKGTDGRDKIIRSAKLAEKTYNEYLEKAQQKYKNIESTYSQEAILNNKDKPTYVLGELADARDKSGRSLGEGKVLDIASATYLVLLDGKPVRVDKKTTDAFKLRSLATNDPISNDSVLNPAALRAKTVIKVTEGLDNFLNSKETDQEGWKVLVDKYKKKLESGLYVNKLIASHKTYGDIVQTIIQAIETEYSARPITEQGLLTTNTEIQPGTLSNITPITGDRPWLAVKKSLLKYGNNGIVLKQIGTDKVFVFGAKYVDGTYKIVNEKGKFVPYLDFRKTNKTAEGVDIFLPIATTTLSNPKLVAQYTEGGYNQTYNQQISGVISQALAPLPIALPAPTPESVVLTNNSKVESSAQLDTKLTVIDELLTKFSTLDSKVAGLSLSPKSLKELNKVRNTVIKGLQSIKGKLEEIKSGGTETLYYGVGYYKAINKNSLKTVNSANKLITSLNTFLANPGVIEFTDILPSAKEAIIELKTTVETPNIKVTEVLPAEVEFVLEGEAPVVNSIQDATTYPVAEIELTVTDDDSQLLLDFNAVLESATVLTPSVESDTTVLVDAIASVKQELVAVEETITTAEATVEDTVSAPETKKKAKTTLKKARAKKLNLQDDILVADSLIKTPTVLNADKSIIESPDIVPHDPKSPDDRAPIKQTKDTYVEALRLSPAAVLELAGNEPTNFFSFLYVNILQLEKSITQKYGSYNSLLAGKRDNVAMKVEIKNAIKQFLKTGDNLSNTFVQLQVLLYEALDTMSKDPAYHDDPYVKMFKIVTTDPKTGARLKLDHAVNKGEFSDPVKLLEFSDDFEKTKKEQAKKGSPASVFFNNMIVPTPNKVFVLKQVNDKTSGGKEKIQNAKTNQEIRAVIDQYYKRYSKLFNENKNLYSALVVELANDLGILKQPVTSPTVAAAGVVQEVVKDRPSLLDTLRDFSTKMQFRKPSKTKFMATSPEIRTRFYEHLLFLRKRGLDTYVVQSVADAGATALAQGEYGVYYTTKDKAKAGIQLAINDLANPSQDNFLTLLHETAHHVIAKMPLGVQQILHTALNRLGDSEMAYYNSKGYATDSRISENNPANLSQEQLARERIVEHLAFQGIDKSYAMGLIDKIFALVKEVYLRGMLSLTSALNLTDAQAKLVKQYAENRMNIFMAGGDVEKLTSFNPITSAKSFLEFFDLYPKSFNTYINKYNVDHDGETQLDPVNVVNDQLYIPQVIGIKPSDLEQNLNSMVEEYCYRNAEVSEDLNFEAIDQEIIAKSNVNYAVLNEVYSLAKTTFDDMKVANPTTDHAILLKQVKELFGVIPTTEELDKNKASFKQIALTKLNDKSSISKINVNTKLSDLTNKVQVDNANDLLYKILAPKLSTTNLFIRMQRAVNRMTENEAKLKTLQEANELVTNDAEIANLNTMFIKVEVSNTLRSLRKGVNRLSDLGQNVGQLESTLGELDSSIKTGITPEYSSLFSLINKGRINVSNAVTALTSLGADLDLPADELKALIKDSPTYSVIKDLKPLLDGTKKANGMFAVALTTARRVQTLSDKKSFTESELLAAKAELVEYKRTLKTDISASEALSQYFKQRTELRSLLSKINLINNEVKLLKEELAYDEAYIENTRLQNKVISKVENRLEEVAAVLGIQGRFLGAEGEVYFVPVTKEDSPKYLGAQIKAGVMKVANYYKAYSSTKPEAEYQSEMRKMKEWLNHNAPKPGEAASTDYRNMLNVYNKLKELRVGPEITKAWRLRGLGAITGFGHSLEYTGIPIAKKLGRRLREYATTVSRLENMATTYGEMYLAYRGKLMKKLKYKSEEQFTLLETKFYYIQENVGYTNGGSLEDTTRSTLDVLLGRDKYDNETFTMFKNLLEVRATQQEKKLLEANATGQLVEDSFSNNPEGLFRPGTTSAESAGLRIDDSGNFILTETTESKYYRRAISRGYVTLPRNTKGVATVALALENQGILELLGTDDGRFTSSVLKTTLLGGELVEGAGEANTPYNPLAEGLESYLNDLNDTLSPFFTGNGYDLFTRALIEETNQPPFTLKIGNLNLQLSSSLVRSIARQTEGSPTMARDFMQKLYEQAILQNYSVLTTEGYTPGSVTKLLSQRVDSLTNKIVNEVLTVLNEQVTDNELDNRKLLKEILTTKGSDTSAILLAMKNGPAVETFYKLANYAYTGKEVQSFSEFAYKNAQNLVNVYMKIKQESSIEPSVDTTGSINSSLLHARVGNDFPISWISYESGDPTSLKVAFGKLAAVNAFGAKLSEFKREAGELNTFISNQQETLQRAKMSVTDWLRLNPDQKISTSNPFKNAEFRKWAADKYFLGDLNALENAVAMQPHADVFKKTFEQLAQGLARIEMPNEDIAVTMEALNFITVASLARVGSAINNLADLMAPIIQFGASKETITQSFKVLGSTLRNAGTGYLQGLGLEIKHNQEYSMLLRELGIYDVTSSARLTTSFLDNGLSDKFENQPMRKFLRRGRNVISGTSISSAKNIFKFTGMESVSDLEKNVKTYASSLNPFVQQLTATKQALVLTTLQQAQLMTLRYMKYFAKTPNLTDEQIRNTTASDLGIHDSIILNDASAMESFVDTMMSSGVDLKRIAYDKVKGHAGVTNGVGNAFTVARASNSLDITFFDKVDMARIAGAVNNDISQESNMVTNFAGANTSRLAEAGTKLMGFSFRRSAQIFNQLRGKDKAEVRKKFMKVAKSMVWAGGMSLAFAALKELWDEEVLGVVNYNQKFGVSDSKTTADNINYNLRTAFERINSTGLFGIVGDFANSALSVSRGEGSRTLKLENRVLALNSLYTGLGAINAYLTEGSVLPNYESVIKPIFQAAGLKAIFEANQFTANWLGLSNIESRIVHRTNTNNYLRKAARMVGVEVNEFAGGGAGTSTPMRPYIRRMASAAQVGDQKEFMAALRLAKLAAKKMDKADVDRAIYTSYNSYDPIKMVFGTKPTDLEMAKVMNTMDPDARAHVIASMNSYSSFKKYLRQSAGIREKGQANLDKLREEFRRR